MPGAKQPLDALTASNQGERPLRHFILGTAGHIDHGKTSLVRALTGVDTDRLPEEQRRGMTIELGFADFTIDDAHFGIVDVPGHERFVRTMVAGATGIDVALLVVAADDSVMPQTREHVDILHLLGIRHAVVALTKIDAVAPDLAELAAEEIREYLAKTPLAAAAVCPVSSITGAGIEALKREILAVARSVAESPAVRPFRLAVDRVFTVQGRGTVVTGSVLRGEVAAGDTLEVFPGGLTCRVRDLQSHGAASAALHRGQRAALNLSGIDRDALERGAELATPGYLQPSHLVDVHLRVLAGCDRPLKNARVMRLCIGTTELAVRVVLLGQAQLDPGAAGFAQLRSGSAIPSAYGQRFILRDENAAHTIGGGVVLRPVAHRRRLAHESEVQSLETLFDGTADQRVEQVLRASGFTTPSDLQVCLRSGVEVAELPAVYARLRQEGRLVRVSDTERCMVPAALDDLAHRLAGWLERFHRAHPDLPGRPLDAVLGWIGRMTDRPLARPLFDRLVSNGTLKLMGRFVCLPAFAPALSAADEKLLAGILSAVRGGGFQPPILDEWPLPGAPDRKRRERLATLAVALGELVLIEPGMFLSAEGESQLRQKVRDLIAACPEGVTVAQVREALNSSRKYVVPFLEHLDRVGFTLRAGDRRVLANRVDEPPEA